LVCFGWLSLGPFQALRLSLRHSDHLLVFTGVSAHHFGTHAETLFERFRQINPISLRNPSPILRIAFLSHSLRHVSTAAPTMTF
jgi:hypothetical protein